ncbi:hypothetical protein BCR42DRAFT_407609 [Absidia repens]|uniref:Uncharacterized protein n=1 Tax=Absidia repens TaxID=90262 RepID=A0A1X2ISL8_9FUNG|nr:hypothetical protein BCR42DRAFT_407609 [Absidia repens]
MYPRISVDNFVSDETRAHDYLQFFSGNSNNPFSPPIIQFSSSQLPTSSIPIQRHEDDHQSQKSSSPMDDTRTLYNELKRMLPLDFVHARHRRRLMRRRRADPLSTSVRKRPTVQPQQQAAVNGSEPGCEHSSTPTEPYLDDPQIIIDDALAYIRRLMREVDFVITQYDEWRHLPKNQEIESAEILLAWKKEMDREEAIFNKHQLSEPPSP